MGSPLPMVNSSTGAMNSLLDKLTALEARHTHQAEGLPESLKSLSDVMQAEGLPESLKSLSEVLQAFAWRMVRDALINEWMLQAREMVYDMEDWIDVCLIDPCWKLEIDFWCPDVAEQIKEFKVQIQDAHERCKRYGLLSEEPISPQDVETKVAIDPELLYGEAPCLVAIDGPRSVLVSHLMDAKQQRKLVCIAGTGGIGKTALATEIYRQLQGQFNCRAFVHLGRSPSVKMTLISIIKQVIPEWRYEKDLWSGCNYDDMEAWDEKKVIAKLSAFLKTKSYFVVLDDVWSILTWKAISCAFPNNDMAVGRILVTTCIKDVAESCCIHPSDVIHQMKGLSENDSKTLFGTKILDPEQQSLRQVDDTLTMCGGMPLAITIIAGLLSVKSARMPLDQHHSTRQGMRKILEICYDDLTPPMKSCFLYLSVFPENYTIKKDRLIQRWEAEGFIPLRETGESYFDELVSRRLIQPVFDDDDDQPIGCTVHGVVFDFIGALSAEENFITEHAELKPGSFPCFYARRVRLDCSEEDDVDTLLCSTYCVLEEKGSSVKDEAISWHLSRVRSLASSGDAKRIPNLSAFRLVRVLDLIDSKGLENEQLGSIGQLFLLRYMGLGGTDITELPQQIMELGHLSSIDLRKTNVQKLPEFKSTNVVSLLTYDLIIPKAMGEMEKLEDLSTVCLSRHGSHPDDVAEFVKRLRSLRMLAVRFSYIAEAERQGVEHFLTEVTNKSNLQSFFLHCYPHSLLDLLLICWSPERQQCLRKFELRLDWFAWPSKVPEVIQFLVGLTHLHIGVLEVDAQGVRALGVIPKLKVLKLYSSNSPRFTVSAEDGFPCLKLFWYCCQHGDAKGLQFETGAMPLLRRLLLDFDASETNFVSGIQHFSCIVQVRATIYCGRASAASEEATEEHIRDQVSHNPNKPALELNRKRQGRLTPHPCRQSPIVETEPAPVEQSVIEIKSLAEWSTHIEEANSMDKLVVIKFTASWCGPSHSISRAFAGHAKNFPNAIFLEVDVDIDEMEHILKQFHIKAAPTFLFMRRGHIEDRLVGADKGKLAKKLQRQMMA